MNLISTFILILLLQFFIVSKNTSFDKKIIRFSLPIIITSFLASVISYIIYVYILKNNNLTYLLVLLIIVFIFIITNLIKKTLSKKLTENELFSIIIVTISSFISILIVSIDNKYLIYKQVIFSIIVNILLLISLYVFLQVKEYIDTKKPNLFKDYSIYFIIASILVILLSRIFI